MKNDNEEDLRPRCAVCGAGGEVVVIRLDTGNLVIDEMCRLHWPSGGMTPDEWAAREQMRCEAFPRACDMSRGEPLRWLFSARRVVAP